MKGKLCCLLLIALCATVNLAQEKKEKSVKPKPDLTGLWMLDTSKVKAKAETQSLEIKLVVAHDEPEIKFTYSTKLGEKREVVYYTDGRGEENAQPVTITLVGRGDEPKEKPRIKSKTKWDGDKLVMSALFSQVVAGHLFITEVVKEWKLSKDGNILTETLRSRNPNAMMRSGGPAMANEYTRVYRRVSEN